MLVLVGGLGAAGGYLAASGCRRWLEPILSWRILWFLNLPTGLLLIFLNVFIPESPKFLLALGRVARSARACCDASAASCATSARRAAGAAPRDAAPRVAVPRALPRRRPAPSASPRSPGA